MTEKLKAPFPYFGGKSSVAHVVWDRFGDVKNYVEPFAGSLAVLLGRPHDAHIETVNDVNCFIANFWRALSADPDDVAKWADWPVNECDLHARHVWLVGREEFKERMKTDPDFYDTKIAGWWVWGLCAWIGYGWCGATAHNNRLPHLLHCGKGVNSKQLPSVDLSTYFRALANRLRRVRVCCGDWVRVTTPCVTTQNGVTGVFLDPPYSDKDRKKNIYADDSMTVAHDVREWAIKNGDNPLMRIALCGYDTEHDMPGDWTMTAWKAPGGYASQAKQADSKGRKNSARETIWFSPHCLPTHDLFSMMEASNER